MSEALKNCPILEYCQMIDRREVPLVDEGQKREFAQGLRRSYMANRSKIQECWLIYLNRCMLDPINWRALGSVGQDFMEEIVDPLEFFGDLDN